MQLSIGQQYGHGQLHDTTHIIMSHKLHIHVHISVIFHICVFHHIAVFCRLRLIVFASWRPRAADSTWARCFSPSHPLQRLLQTWNRPFAAHTSGRRPWTGWDPRAMSDLQLSARRLPNVVYTDPKFSNLPDAVHLVQSAYLVTRTHLGSKFVGGAESLESIFDSICKYLSYITRILVNDIHSQHRQYDMSVIMSPA